MWIPANKRQLLGLSQTGDLGPFTIYTDKWRRPVWFYKAPPQKPPSDRQIQQRLRFRFAAQAWQQLSAETRTTWARACARAHLFVSGYNLWVYWQVTRDRQTILTIQNQTGITLLQP